LASEEIISGEESSRVVLLLDVRMNQGNADIWVPCPIERGSLLKNPKGWWFVMKNEEVYVRKGNTTMMGTKARTVAPLMNISLEDLVPQDHLYRHREQTLDLSFVRKCVQETDAKAGRPSIDPVVFLKLQLVLFFEGIRSERERMRQAADRLSILWYLGSNLGETLPDHSSLTRIRARYGVEVFGPIQTSTPLKAEACHTDVHCTP
jgi:transposase